MLSNSFLIKCVYVKLMENSYVMFSLYVNDILIFGRDTHVIDDIKKFLKNNFDMKDLGPLDVILGIKIIKDGDSISLTQSHYIKKLLKIFNFYEVSPFSTPVDPTINLKKDKGSSVSQYKYF